MSDVSDEHDRRRDEELVAERAELLPEEETVGSVDPERQAEEILRDSQSRTDDPEGTQRDSVQSP